MFSWCFLSVSRYFEFLKKPQNMFRWCFLSVSKYFSIVRNLSREPDFSADNRICKNLSKSKNMFNFLSVSWYFCIIRHLSREPDFSAKNRIFKNFSRCLKACLVGNFWVFQSSFSIVRNLSREPDFLAENRIFKNFSKSLKTCLIFWVFHGILALFDIWAENRIFQQRIGFSKISQDASKRV